MSELERIGFVGLGVMGAPMAANLVRAGATVTVHDRDRGAVDALASEGAEVAVSPRAVAEAGDVVITMLPDSPDVEEVVLGEGGVAEGMGEGMLLIDMSTVAPATARAVHAALAERGAEAVDAPVSGGEAAAKSGELTIMAGGGDAAVERARPIFDVLGKSAVHIGPPGAGQVTKAANQVVIALTILGVAEALLLARRAGVDPARVREVLLGGFAQSKVLEAHGQRMLDRSFDPGFRLALHRKDLAIALQTAREEGVPLPATAMAAELMNAMLAQGAGDRDHSALVQIYEQLSGE